MQTSLFDFTLPELLIAASPASPRDSARMLVVADSLVDKNIRDLLDYLQAGDVMVFNDTRVIPARLLGKRGDAKIEILLHKKFPLPNRGRVGVGASTQDRGLNAPLLTSPLMGEEYWQCFAKPAKKLKVGDVVKFAEDFSAIVESKEEDGQVILHFATEKFQEKLQKYGAIPLPPYIEKKRNPHPNLLPKREKELTSPSPFQGEGGVRVDDSQCYQTIYAKHDGSVAAPTAGLHFTPELLAAIDAKGVARVHVTLHVGGGTFLPVKVEDTSAHVMHSEYAEISQEAANIINAAKRVIAVGTTSLRTLESAADAAGRVKPFSAETNIFITPGYRFKCVDVLMTNFHLPKSTLFMLVSAFCGLDTMQKAYAHAIEKGYRFYSYGDACLLFKSECHSAAAGEQNP